MYETHSDFYDYVGTRWRVLVPRASPNVPFRFAQTRRT